MEAKIANGQMLEELITLDELVIGDKRRAAYLKDSIANSRCHVVIIKGRIAGFLTHDTNFFENIFISLVIVHPEERKKGAASLLIKEFEKRCGAEKIFSSTNSSNLPMQKVFDSLGYEGCGFIDQLDEGDPELIYIKKIKA